VQDPALALVEPHQVPLCPALQPIQVTLNGSVIDVIVVLSYCEVCALYKSSHCPLHLKVVGREANYIAEAMVFP